MESLLGFKGTTTNLDENYKLVPWLNWDEWDFVRLSLFSSSPDSISKALHRVAAWRSRGCLPIAIEVTASIVEIQQKDSYFRVCLSDDDSNSEGMLAMLYTMAIMRLVNGVIEKTRKKAEISIAEAAAAINLPRMLIDIRHEGSHRELPSLRLLRLASVKALSWLKSYYWDPQKNMIPYQRGKTANVRKKIKSKLRELAFSLKVKQISGSNSSQIKRKSARHHELVMGATVHGRNKFFSLVACKNQPSKYVGSRKQLKRILKDLIRLYSFFSSDVVLVLLEFLLKASNSIMDMGDYRDNFQVNLTLDAARTIFDEWKPVITKFSKQEPEVLFGLLKAVLDMIESRKAIRDDFGSEHFSLSLYDLETQRIKVLSSLFIWLLLLLKGSPHSEGQGSHGEAACVIPEQMLIELLRKCLHISDPENHELLDAAVLLGKIAGGSYMNEKLRKLSLLTLSSSRLSEDNPAMKTEALIFQNKHIRQAAEKLELLKLGKLNNPKSLKIRDDNGEDTNMWTVAKSWNPCPIGMLPRAVGSSGCLPVLDCGTNYEHEATLNSPSQDKKEEIRHCGEREANCDIEAVGDSDYEMTRETENHDLYEQEDMNVTTMPYDGLKGRLLIDGVWQKVGDQELQDIKSRVSIFVNEKRT